jgi:molybdate transport system substrate-binding protein
MERTFECIFGENSTQRAELTLSAVVACCRGCREQILFYWWVIATKPVSLTRRSTPTPSGAKVQFAVVGKSISGRLTALLLVMVTLLAAAPAHADYPVAPDVVVFCEPTLQHALINAAALWRSESGVKARIFTAPTTALLLAEIAHHARDDVIIGEGDANAAAAKTQQLIKPDSLRLLGRNGLVIAALAGTAAAAGGGDSLAAIAGKDPVAIVDPWAATAGADSKQALQSLGLWEKVGAKSIGVVGTADAAFLLSQGKARLAIVYATDVAANPAFTIVERLPASSYPPVVYWVAETTHALSPNAAKFIAFLTSATARDRLRADGIEVSP